MLTNPGLARRVKSILKFKDYSCIELSEITESKLFQRDIRFPHNVRDEFSEAFYKLTEDVRSKHNAALCEDLIDNIQCCQEERLDPENVSRADLFKFTSTDVANGIRRFLSSHETNSLDKVSVGCQTTDLVISYPGVGLLFSHVPT